MDNSTDQSNCMDKSEAYPIILREYIYENSNDNKNTECSSDQLILWKQEKNNDGYDTVFDSIKFNEGKEKKISEENKLKFEQCSCQKILNTIKELLKPCSDEPNGTNPSKKSSQEDIFCNLKIDLNSDNYGKDLQYYELDGEYLNTYVQEMKNNELNNELTYSEEKESTTDELMKLEELQEKPKDETKTDNNNKIQDKKSNYINNDIAEDIRNKTAGDTNDVQVKYRQKSSTNRGVNKNRKKVQLSFKRTLCRSNCVTKNNEVQEKECNIKYLYTYGEDYRGGIKCGHEKCVDTFKGVPWNKGWITDEHLAEDREKINIRKRLQNEKEQIYQMELALKKKAMEMKDSQSNAMMNSNESMNSNGDSIINNDTRVAKPLLELNKNNGLYTITMNSMTFNEKPEEPVVIRLNTLMNTTEYVSSSSSLDLEFLPPAAMYASRPRVRRRHASTSYDKMHFQPPIEERKNK